VTFHHLTDFHLTDFHLTDFHLGTTPHWHIPTMEERTT
jgi:hypothetical protein